MKISIIQEGQSPEPEETLPISFSVNKYGETICCSDSSDVASGDSSSGDDAPRFIGRYELRRALGHGAFGTVFLAYDSQLDRDVAIKAPNISTVSESSKQEVQEIILREARQLAQIKHPNIVVVHDVGFEDEGCHVVSDYIEGQDLNRWMQDNAPTWMESIQMIAPIADGLASAHAAGVVHRDVKPANIIVSDRTEGPVPILVDFGLAISKATANVAGNRRGDISGTPNYMSPEQAAGDGHRIDGRTDIYSLGVILYRLLTGQLPFVASNVTSLLEQVISDEPRPPRQFVQGIPRRLEEICLKAIAKKIPDRYTTAADFAQDLRDLIEGNEMDESLSSTPTSHPLLNSISESNSPLTILIAEDNEVSRVKLQADLEKWGHNVVAAEDGEEAWNRFQKGKFSIVITDWMMPNVDGLELVKRIRASRQNLYTYIIMLTAKSEKHDIVLGIGAGADDFLSKPFHRDELNVRLRAGKRIIDMTRAIAKSSRRMERGTRAAAKVQQSFLPTALPHSDHATFAYKYEPCDELGGDMLNIIPLDDTHIAIYVLDVNGSGVPASMLATNVSRFIASPTEENSILVDRQTDSGQSKIVAPEDVARKLNQHFSGNLENSQFFTIVYGILNVATREFQYVCAGHPPVIHQTSEGETTLLEGLGLPIGVAPDNDDYTRESITLNSGDRIFLYSNGLLNLPKLDGELYGSKRVVKSLITHRGLAIQEAIENVVEEAEAFGEDGTLSDDLTILGIEIH